MDVKHHVSFHLIKHGCSGIQDSTVIPVTRQHCQPCYKTALLNLLQHSTVDPLTTQYCQPSYNTALSALLRVAVCSNSCGSSLSRVHLLTPAVLHVDCYVTGWNMQYELRR